MFNFFSNLRRKVAEAVIGGVADAMQAVSPDPDAPANDLAELRGMLAAATAPKSLPAAAKDEPEATKKRKN